MQIQKQHYAELKAMVTKADSERVARGQPGYLKTAAEYRERGLSPTRFRGDWLRIAVPTRWICDVLYPAGLNDDHLESALKQIARELTDDRRHWTAS